MNDVIKDLSELRLNYQKGELHEEQVNADPHEQFLLWFNHALAAQLHEPYAMSLATANAQGRPHVRTVLLRGATHSGYDFYTKMGARTLPNGHSILGTKFSIHSEYADVPGYRDQLVAAHGEARECLDQSGLGRSYLLYQVHGRDDLDQFGGAPLGRYGQ